VAIPHQTSPTTPPGPAKFTLGRFAIWLAVCLVAAWVLAAWPAAQIGQYFAPLVLFPLLEGLALGGMTLLLLRICHQGHCLSAIAGLLLIVSTFIVSQHYAAYLAARTAAVELQEKIASRPSADNGKQAFAVAAAQLAPQPPENLFQYLQEEAERGRPLFHNVTVHGGGVFKSKENAKDGQPLVRDITARGPWAWASWALDGLLVLAAASLVVVPVLKQPYCNSCHSWYRVVRAGAVTPEAERAICAACNCSDEVPSSATRFALLSCQNSCGPDAIDFFDETNARRPAPRQHRIWLSVAQRQAVTAILDQQTSRGGTES
jgi:hypothetical protein